MEKVGDNSVCFIFIKDVDCEFLFLFVFLLVLLKYVIDLEKFE